MDHSNTEQLVRLLATHQESIYRYVFALLPNEHDAKDVVQEVCIALYRKFHDYDSERPFLPWAFRFAYLQVLKHREQQQRTVLSLGDDIVELLARERDEQTQVLDARLQALESCLRELPKQDLQMVNGRYESAMSMDELARLVDMSPRSLYRNLQRIRGVLLNCINGKVAAEGLA